MAIGGPSLGAGAAATPSVRFAPNVGPLAGNGLGPGGGHPGRPALGGGPYKDAPGSGFGDPLGGPLDPTSRTYASLVQQYLAALCVDNATFYAERMVAHRPTEVAVHLLAACHYRSGRVRRARSVLLEHGTCLCGSHGGGSHGGGIADGSGALPDLLGGPTSARGTVRAASAYLLARCCSDLRLYAEAEDALLRPCREAYRAAHPSNSSPFPPGEGGGDGPLDEWIVRAGPCPVPNGAAGLALLGSICRRSDRPGRAAKYYRMSLRVSTVQCSAVHYSTVQYSTVEQGYERDCMEWNARWLHVCGGKRANAWLPQTSPSLVSRLPLHQP